jgi:hypothetical protein
MTCEAEPRSLYQPAGWTCNGEDLLVVIPASRMMPPAVIRADLVDRLDDPTRSLFDANGQPLPAGADHLHIIIRADSNAGAHPNTGA